MAFFVESKSAREPFLRAPGAVIGLIAVLVAAHLARVFAPSALSERILNDYALNPARYSAHYLAVHHADPGSIVDRVLPFFAYMLLHADTTHIAINCLWLLAFGPVVARRFGGAAFVLFFVLCGLAGAACYLAFNWGDDAGVIGASGAISGLMGAAIRMMRIRQPYLNVATLPLLPILSRQVLGFSAVWMAVNLVTGIFAIGLTGQYQAVAWEDHMGGYVAGLILAGVFEPIVGLAARQSRGGA
jgi:membrane associated rhomboid family serine protease